MVISCNYGGPIWLDVAAFPRTGEMKFWTHVWGSGITGKETEGRYC